MINLQPGYKCESGDIIITFIDQWHLTLKIFDVALENFPLLHLDSEEIVDVLLKLLSLSILVIEEITDLLKVPKEP